MAWLTRFTGLVLVLGGIEKMHTSSGSWESLEHTALWQNHWHKDLLDALLKVDGDVVEVVESLTWGLRQS